MLRGLTKPTARPGAGLPASLRGALWMGAAAIAFALMVTLVRQLTDGLHPLQVVFFRTAFGLAAMLPWLLRQGFGVLRTEHLRRHLLRALIAILAMVGWFTTLSLMPLAEATALSFTAPLFTSVLAVLVLGEVMSPRRWSAVGIGFLGALVIVRPGFAAIQPAALLAIGTAAIWAFSTILIKTMARTESAGAITTYMALLTTPMTLLAALFVWQNAEPRAARLGRAAGRRGQRGAHLHGARARRRGCQPRGAARLSAPADRRADRVRRVRRGPRRLGLARRRGHRGEQHLSRAAREPEHRSPERNPGARQTEDLMRRPTAGRLPATT